MISTNLAPAVHQPNDFLVAESHSPALDPNRIEGYISRTGKLVIPNRSVDQLQLDFNLMNVRMKVGVDAQENNINTLYLVPTEKTIVEAFTVNQAAKGYTIKLGTILLKEGIMYKTTRYTFVIEPFFFDDGTGAYRLRLQEPTPRLFYIWSAFKALQRQ